MVTGVIGVARGGQGHNIESTDTFWRQPSDRVRGHAVANVCMVCNSALTWADHGVETHAGR